MTNWLPSVADRPGPRYIAIADAMSADVAAKRLKAGDRLPPHRDLAWKLGVTVGTVSRAYAEATRRGLINGEVGRGTYIRALETAEDQWLANAPVEDSGVIDLGFSFPPPGDAGLAIGPALEKLAVNPRTASLLGYQPHAGLASHRAAGADWLALGGLEVPAERLVITSGAHHGIIVALAALLRPGDRLLTEALTYPGIQPVARMLGLRLESVASDDQGLLPDALEAACRTTEFKALYCVPTLQNPTTRTIPEDRRRAIAAIAERHNIAILEDDIFGLLTDDRPPPISHFAPDHGFYITSLSKTVAPGLRTGFVAGPERSVGRLAGAVRATCWMAPPLTAEIATGWIRDGTAERILKSNRQELEKRRQLALDVLGSWDAACPQGSLHVWLHLPDPWRATDFVAEAARRGVIVTSAERFAISRRDVPHAVRICLGPPAQHEILKIALDRLAEILCQGPPDSLDSIV